MAQDLEKAASRLQNIEAVNPILGALRTISLGNWQMALNKRKSILHYKDKLIDLVPFILPHIKVPTKRLFSAYRRSKHPPESNVLVVGLGTERGLCGRYNTTAWTVYYTTVI